MKQGIRAAIMLAVSCVVLICWQISLNRLPELEDISAFDVSRYPTTCQLQALKIAPNDKQWTLDSVRFYTADGVLEDEMIYQLDESGLSYYLTPDGNRVDRVNLSLEGMQSILTALSDCDIFDERRDEYARLVFRQGVYPLSPEQTWYAYWAYAPGEAKWNLTDELCSVVQICHSVAPEGEDAPYLDGDLNAVAEATTYYIRNYDKFGNEIKLWISDECYLQTDSDGYLQMIVIKWYGGYEVVRTDTSGRPLWIARYSREDLTLQSYTVWTYRSV